MNLVVKQPIESAILCKKTHDIHKSFLWDQERKYHNQKYSLLKQFSGQSQPFFIFNATSRRFSSEYLASSSLFKFNFFSLFFTFRVFCIFTTVFDFLTLLFFLTFFVGDDFFFMDSSTDISLFLSVAEVSPG